MSNFAIYKMETPSSMSRSSIPTIQRPPPPPVPVGGGVRSSQPVSRLQLIQAQFQRKLLLEKEEKMMQLYPEDGGSNNGSSSKQQRSREKGGGGGNGGGAVRQFFAQRRANNNSMDPLSSSGGIISLQSSMNGGFSTGTYGKNGPKHGSPIGWDKSYPLSPLDRDSSGSSSGYDSGNSFGSNFGASPYKNNNNNNNNNTNNNKNGTMKNQGGTVNGQRPAVRRNFGALHQLPPPSVAANPVVTKPARRAPSLDRRPRNNNVVTKTNANGMRRSNSQILNGNRNRDENEDHEQHQQVDGFIPFSRIRKSPQTKQVPKAAPATRNSRPSNTKPVTKTPSNNTYKVSSPNRDVPFDSDSLNASPKGKKPIVPAIGYVVPSKPVHMPNMKSPISRSIGRSSVDPNLVECTICGRNFAKDRIDKHTVICEKSNTKKRKVFDSTKMRMKETDLEQFVRHTGKGGRKAVEQPTSGKKSNWRQKRENFIESLRQAKVVQRHLAAGGKVSDLPPPPPMDTSDYILCPHCSRKFSEGVAERHIPKCKNIKSNKNGEVNRR